MTKNNFQSGEVIKRKDLTPQQQILFDQYHDNLRDLSMSTSAHHGKHGVFMDWGANPNNKQFKMTYFIIVIYESFKSVKKSTTINLYV